MRRKSIISLALEENSKGVTEVEREQTFYALLSPEVASLAKVYEDQEQWQLTLPRSKEGFAGTIRVRRSADQAGNVTYSQTLKIAQPGSKPGATAVDETQLGVTEDFFNQFKRVAAAGMIKRRLFIKTTDGDELQVDVFKDYLGKYSERVKIDYEFYDGMPATPAFPNIFSDIVPGDTADPDQIQRIKMWYAMIFTAQRK